MPVLRHVERLIAADGLWPDFSHRVEALCDGVKAEVYAPEAWDRQRNAVMPIYRRGIVSHRPELSLEQAIDFTIGHYGIQAETNNGLAQFVTNHLIYPFGRRSPVEHLARVVGRMDAPSQLAGGGQGSPVSRALGMPADETVRRALTRSADETERFLDGNRRTIAPAALDSLAAQVKAYRESFSRIDAWAREGAVLVAERMAAAAR